MRNVDFFTMDRLGICPTFYKIPVQMATGVDPADIVARARKAYKGYPFYQDDLRDKIRNSGTRDIADESIVQRPHSPPNDSHPMETDSTIEVVDLRDIFTGKQRPANLSCSLSQS